MKLSKTPGNRTFDALKNTKDGFTFVSFVSFVVIDAE
jgi:hypothetical protein